MISAGPRGGARTERQEAHTLSIRDIPEFPAPDMFSGEATAPYRGFGDVIPDSGALELKLHADAVQVRKDVRETFRVKLESSTSIPIELDKIMEKMWATGWDPRVGDLNLFTRDFGLILLEATLDLLGGRPVFRSPGEDIYVHKNARRQASRAGQTTVPSATVPSADACASAGNGGHCGSAVGIGG